MYNKEYFYGLTDLLHFNVYATLLKEHIIKEERVVIKVFKKEEEIVVIETYNFVDTILKDTRVNKDSDLMEFDLIFLKTLERYYADYEMKGMIYEYMEGLGSWYRVKVDNHDPLNKIYRPFYLKKKIKREELSNYCKNKDDLSKLQELYDLSKGLIKFTNPSKIEELFLSIEK